MRLIPLSTLFPLVALASSANPVEFRASDKAIFVMREPSFTATSSVPIFRATVDNRAGEDWDDVHVEIQVWLKCPDGRNPSVIFTASLGYLFAGDNEASDTAVSARGALDSGCEASDFAAHFKSGHAVSPTVSAQRERTRKEEAERRQKIEAERRREEEELEFQRQAHQAALEAEQREREAVRAQCHQVFVATAAKKVTDLTVLEDRAVKNCDALGYYQ